MNTKTKTGKRKYVTLAITREAHQALKRKAKAERRSIVQTLNILMGV